MLTQTNEQLDRFLAEDVMGWHDNGMGMWVDEKSRPRMYTSKKYIKYDEGASVWHPTADITQVIWCAEKWCNTIGCAITCTYVSVSKTWIIELWNGAWDIACHTENEKQSLAISLALYEAYCVSLVGKRKLTEEEQEYAMKIDLKSYEKYIKGDKNE